MKDEKVIGRVLYGPDNGYSLLDHVTDVPRCPICNEILSKNIDLTGFKPERIRDDCSCTYDGFKIVSKEFVKIWERVGGSGLAFSFLPDVPHLAVVTAEPVLAFNSERRGTRFIKYKECCGRYQGVIGATPAFLKEPSELKGEVGYRTDLSFGSGDAKKPLILFPLELAEALVGEGLSGIIYRDILQ